MKNILLAIFMLVLFFILLCVSANAELPNTSFDPDMMAKVILSFLGAPTWKAGIAIVGIIAMCILSIAKYFWDRNAREKEAYEYSLKVRLEQEKNTARMQKDAAESLMLNMDIAYQQDYEFYIQKISEGDFKAVYPKTPVQFHEKIATFLYRDDLSSAVRAAMIIDVVRRKA